MKLCERCGNQLSDEQKFCDRCGTGQQTMHTCNCCGETLRNNQAFCSACGYDMRSTTEMARTQDAYQKQNAVRKPKNVGRTILLVIVLLLTAATLAVCIYMIADLLTPVEDLCLQGRYEDAYDRADGRQKDRVVAENIAAVQSAYAAENLKDPDSFELRKAYYYDGTDSEGKKFAKLVLYISGKNSYGAKVSSYWYFSWDTEYNEWMYRCSVNSLEDEKIYDFDDLDTQVDTLAKNIYRIHIQDTIYNGIELDKDAVGRINTMFEEDRLDKVESLDIW